MPAEARDPQTFLDVFVSPMPIRSRGSFHLVACRVADDQRPVVVVFAPRAQDRDAANAAIRAVADAHARIDHPLVPRLARQGVSREGMAWAALDFAAAIDGAELVRLLAASQVKLAYALADTFATTLREAMQAAHACVDPRTNEPLCLGEIANGNVLFSSDGRHALVGFGHNFVTRSERGAIEGVEPVSSAPEVATGARPTPMSDYVALLKWIRTYLHHIDVVPMVVRIIAGHFSPGDGELIKHMRFFENDVIHNAAQLRPSMEEAIAVSERIRVLLDLELDREGLTAAIRDLLERFGDAYDPRDSGGPPAAPVTDDRQSVRLAPDGAWIEPPGSERRTLGRAQRRIALALAQARRETPGKTLGVWDLLEAGWPGEQPVYEAAMNRVYVTVSRMRKLGLGAVLETFEEGYRFSPSVQVATAEA